MGMDARRARRGFRRRPAAKLAGLDQCVEESDQAVPIHAEHELGPPQTCPAPPQQQEAGEKCGLDFPKATTSLQRGRHEHTGNTRKESGH